MASTISPSAIHRIMILLVECDDVYGEYQLLEVNTKWNAVYTLYMDIKPAPSLDYLGSWELELVLMGEVDDEDVRVIFAHGKPLVFWGCPSLLVSKIVEAFVELHEEPRYLDVIVTALDGVGATRPSEAWSEVYTTHIPCRACTTVDNADVFSLFSWQSGGKK